MTELRMHCVTGDGSYMKILSSGVVEIYEPSDKYRASVQLLPEQFQQIANFINDCAPKRENSYEYLQITGDRLRSEHEVYFGKRWQIIRYLSHHSETISVWFRGSKEKVLFRRDSMYKIRLLNKPES